MKQEVLQVHPKDNVLVALTDLPKGYKISYNGEEWNLQDAVKAKHKFTTEELNQGDPVYMYGVLVGKAQQQILKGGLISTTNIKHASDNFGMGERKTDWHIPDVSKWQNKTFMGYHRADGTVGTANYWVVIPMVFCENRNLEVLEESLVKDLGYGRNQTYKAQAKQLIDLCWQFPTLTDAAQLPRIAALS